MSSKRLERLPKQGQIAGVCAGLAEYFDIDVSMVRLAFILAAVFSGGGFVIAYLVLAIVLPTGAGKGIEALKSEESAGEYLKENVANLKREFSHTDRGARTKTYLGLALVLLGLWLLIMQWFPSLFELFSWKFVMPILLIALGIYVVTRRESRDGK